MKTFNLKIYASDHVYYDGDCEHLMIPTEDGYYGILANHRNTISSVEPGILNYRLPNGEKKEAAVTRGMIKIEDNSVLVLVFRCEDPDMIDINDIKRREEEAIRKIRQKNSKKEYHSAEANISRAMNNLKKKNRKI